MRIGNDIVDIEESQKTPHHPRFARRVLSDEEYKSYCNSIDKDQFLLKAWAAKEASYKYFKQVDHSCKFSPAQFEYDEIHHRVVYRSMTVKIAFLNTEHFIFCYAMNGKENHIHLIKEKTLADESTEVRDMLTEYTLQSFAVRKEHVKILKDKNNIPKLYILGQEPKIFPISLTHHGKYVAATMIL